MTVFLLSQVKHKILTDVKSKTCFVKCFSKASEIRIFGNEENFKANAWRKNFIVLNNKNI